MRSSPMFTYGYGSAGLPPTTTSPVDALSAVALREAYDLAIEISCTPRALAVCSSALRWPFANDVTSDTSPLDVPLDCIAPPDLGTSVVAWYRSRPVRVVVDLHSGIYDRRKYLPDASVIYISGQVVACLSASFWLELSNPELWRRHLLLTAIVIAREMFCYLRYSKHCRLSRYSHPQFWSDTAVHDQCCPQEFDNPVKAGAWWEDKVFGGAIEGLLYDSQVSAYHRGLRNVYFCPDTSARPVAFIKALCLRSGQMPGRWGEIPQYVVDRLCDDPSRYALPLSNRITVFKERVYRVPFYLNRGGEVFFMNVVGWRQGNQGLSAFGV
ncbi:hypothetical protein LshimejAT787_1103540 [Lyophyllum shimeji]|uniref:Uncharacterized protein n=1 Tax=Lyophyllum shimeji TaxID=47721 RepID=A0A9P3UP48_LYOSH|nr:hypothetical protein LshimejAT787_1103540 [Lyophyllum shimeji]